MKTYLVTGGAGFMGSNFIRSIIKEKGNKVINVDNLTYAGSLSTIKDLLSNKNHIFIKSDISNIKKIRNILKKFKPDYVVNFAAETHVDRSIDNPDIFIKTNILAFFNFINNVKEFWSKIKKKKQKFRFILVSTDEVYGSLKSGKASEEYPIRSSSPYSASKAGAEIIFHSYQKSFFQNNKKIKFATGRAGNVIGGGDMKKDGIIPDIIRSIKLKRKLVVRNPKSIRPWQHVLEALSGYLVLGSLLIKNKLDNSCYPSWNFGPKGLEKKTVIQLVKEFLKTWEIKKSIYLLKSKKFEESKLLILDSKKATRELKWRPRLSFKETINLTVQWYKSYFLKKNLEKLTVSQINYYTNK